ncbi:effector-associated domain 2-containing protein [Streptomyces sp. NPDC003011]
MTGPRPAAGAEPPRVDPARVHALIVGVERYDAGSGWDLPGPARDAVAFHRLLRAAGVPDAHLRLHLAPLPPYTPEVPYEPADHATLRRVLVRELAPVQGDLLWVWWGGHGVLDRAGHLRLFCADASTDDKLGIDLDSALARYAGDAVPGFAEQLWIVDACETFEEDLAFREQLPQDALPVGRPTLAHRQTVLRAAGRGRAAANDPVRGTGLFSDVLLGLLADRTAQLPAPPDPEELFPAVRTRIAALREAGRTLQHPEIQLRSPARTEYLPPAGPAAGQRPVSPLQRAVEALLAYPLMQDPVERQTVVTALDPHVTATLPRHTKARTDAAGILNGLARHRPDALWDLFDAVVSVDDHPGRKDELSAALRDVAASAGRPRDRG